MNVDDRGDDLDRARQALIVAYDRARAAGYQPGSFEMHALYRAEQHYEHVRGVREDLRTSPHTDQDPDPDRDDGHGGHRGDRDSRDGHGAVSRVIDLRENMPDTAETAPGPPPRARRRAVPRHDRAAPAQPDEG